MQRMGHQRLAGAGFAVDQHMAVGLPQIQDILAQPFHHARLADQLLHQHAAIRQLAPQRPVVQRQPTGLRGLLGQFGHPVGVERLFQEIEGPHPHRFHGHRHIAMPGDQDHRQAAVLSHQLLEKGHPVHARHADVADNHPWKVWSDAFQRIFGTAIGFRIEPRQGQPLADRLPHVRLVIDDRDLHRTYHVTSLGCLRRGARRGRNTIRGIRFLG